MVFIFVVVIIVVVVVLVSVLILTKVSLGLNLGLSLSLGLIFGHEQDRMAQDRTRQAFWEVSPELIGQAFCWLEFAGFGMTSMAWQSLA